MALGTILEAMKGELARLEAEQARWEAEYDAAEREFQKRLEPIRCYKSELFRLKQAIAALES